MVRPPEDQAEQKIMGAGAPRILNTDTKTEKGYGEMGPRDTARLLRDFTDLPDFGKQKMRMKIKGNIGGNVTSRI